MPRLPPVTRATGYDAVMAPTRIRIVGSFWRHGDWPIIIATSPSRRPMSESRPAKLTYRDAGLDLDLYEKSLAGMAPFIKRTHTLRVLDGFGGFASLFSLDYNSRLFAQNYRHPVLLTCTDGLGTKLKVASLCHKH